jgi:hypothetical protein
VVGGDTLFAQGSEARMAGITRKTTVREALPLLSPGEQISLHYWAAEFSIKLCEFHQGHIRTYENQRLLSESRYGFYGKRKIERGFD